MTKAVGKNDIASLVCKVYGCIITCLIFRNVPFDDDLIIRKSKCFLHTLCTGIMSGCITFILITDKNKTNFKSLTSTPSPTFSAVSPVDSAAVDSAAVSLSPDAGAVFPFFLNYRKLQEKQPLLRSIQVPKTFFIVTTSLLRVLKNKKRHELLTIHASLHDKIPSLSAIVFKRSANFSITLIFGVSTISVFRFSYFIYKNDYIFQICVILSITISIFYKNILTILRILQDPC